MPSMPPEVPPVSPPPLPSERLEPVGRGERIASLDILRGFALLGILVVNMRIFSEPVYLMVTDLEFHAGALDRGFRMLVSWFAEGKFYSLFSLLFGLGIAIQMRRSELAGIRSTSLLRRRLGWLLVIGCLHAVFIWEGDILVIYALLGFLLLLFRRCRPRSLIIWAVVFLLIPVVLNVGVLGLILVLQIVPGTGDAVMEALRSQETGYVAMVERSYEAFAHGDWGDIQRMRLRNLAFLYSLAFFYVPGILAMFLIGLALGKAGVHERLEALKGRLSRYGFWCLVIGLILNAYYAKVRLTNSPNDPTLENVMAGVVFTFGAPLLALGYAGIIGYLVLRPGVRNWLAPVAAMGRVALSQYLLQSIVCTTIFYSYGLGWYGRVGPAGTTALALAFYAAQLMLSAWWTRRFRFGPAEWLWRSLTYKRWQPMRPEYDLGRGVASDTVTGMKSTFCILLTTSLMIVGCGQQESDTPPGSGATNTNASSSGNPLTAPVDYLGAAVNAKKSSEVTIQTASLNQAIRQFEAAEGRIPKDLNELVKEGYINSIPEAPYNMKITYDATKGEVKVVPK